ncbi:MAG: EAL domain-containing protein [Pseudomonadota bacterium]
MANEQFNLVRRYAIALLLIAALATVKLIATNMNWRTLDSFGEVINLSGRQRTLSQKILLHSEQLNAPDLLGNANAQGDLKSVLSEFDAVHKRLTTTNGFGSQSESLPVDVTSIYFTGDNSLDRKTKSYIANARIVLANNSEQAAAALNDLRATAAPLLLDLNAVVHVYEAALNNRLAMIRKLAYIAYGVTLFLLIGEGLLIFRPAHLRIKKGFNELQKEIREKEKVNDLLKVTLNNIDQGVIVFDKDDRLLLWSKGLENLLDIPSDWFDSTRTASDFVDLNKKRKDISEGETSFFDHVAHRSRTEFPPKEDTEKFKSRFLKTRKNGVHLEVVGRVVDGGRVLATYTDVTDEINSRRTIEQLAWTDQLTGLNNRNSLRSTLRRICQAADRTQSKIAVIVLDLDHFKPINDTYGHDAGDTVLKVVGERITDVLRGHDIAFRLDGDEFAAIINCEDDADALNTVMQRLSDTIEQPIIYEGNSLSVRLSAGAACYPDNETNVDELIRKADTALYEAKNAGRGCFRTYDEQVDHKAKTLRRIEDELRIGVRRGELALFYQGKRSVSDATLVGAEALVRWHHPDRGIVPPGDFISVVEKTDLVFPVGTWVMQRAWRTANNWIKDTTAFPFSMGVNVSARQFFDPGFIALLKELAETRPELASKIDLEITEEIMIGDINTVVSIMSELRAIGYSISMDDFGTGYSSISYLHRLPISTIKIDRSFLRDVTTNQHSEKIVRAIIDLGKNLGLNTLAEGVETEEQLAFLRDAGCRSMQGFLFDRPIEQKEFESIHFPNLKTAKSA